MFGTEQVHLGLETADSGLALAILPEIEVDPVFTINVGSPAIADLG